MLSLPKHDGQIVEPFKRPRLILPNRLKRQLFSAVKLLAPMKNYRLAVFPADGIGPEVIAASRQVLWKLKELHGSVRFETRDFD